MRPQHRGRGKTCRPRLALTPPPCSRSLAASWLTFAFALAYDLVPFAPFAKIKTAIAVLAVPVEGLVGLLYWSLTIINPALLNPATEPGKEPFRIPLALDVSLHGLPAVSPASLASRLDSRLLR